MTNKIPYDTAYFEHMIEIYAGSGHRINQIRWGFIASCEPQMVLDYGCGCGFFQLYKPDDVIIDSYDIGKIGDADYPQTGIRHEFYDLICLWDVLEHIDWTTEPDNNILHWINRANNVALTIPVLPLGMPLEGWKHHKPGEHLTYFTSESLVEFIEGQGFTLTKKGMPECPPRTDIQSFLFTRTS